MYYVWHTPVLTHSGNSRKSIVSCHTNLYASNQIIKKITHGRTRTPNLSLRRATRYPLRHMGETDFFFKSGVNSGVKTARKMNVNSSGCSNFALRKWKCQMLNAYLSSSEVLASRRSDEIFLNDFTILSA